MSITRTSETTAAASAFAFIACSAAQFDAVGFALLDAAKEINACVADEDQVQVTITESAGQESAFGELLLTVTAQDNLAAVRGLSQLMDSVTESV